jgi:integrase
MVVGRPYRMAFRQLRSGIGALRAACKRACTQAGFAGRLVHDLRRTAARDLRRKGVSEGVIMKLCGWKPRSMFDRYNIIDEDDLARSAELAFNGKQPANTAPAEPAAASLS